MTDAFRTSLRTWHAWMMALPPQFLLAAGAGAFLNLASDLSNSFAAAPHFGGPLVALGIFLAYLGMFGLGLGGVVPYARLRRLGSLLVARVLSDQRILVKDNKTQGRAARAHRNAITTFPGGVPARLRILVVYLLVAWVLGAGVQTLRVIATMPTALASPAHYGSDELFYAQYNAALVLHGQNPYAGEHLAGALRTFHTEQVTPLRAGAFTDPRQPPTKAQLHTIVTAYEANPDAPHPNLDAATTHSYPALSFLLAVPSVWAGLPTLGYAQLLGLLALISGIVALTNPRWRLASLALCLMDVDGIRSVATSDFAMWTVAGIALVWALRDKPWLAAGLLGAVCAVQQTAWFFAPFFLVYVFREIGWRTTVRVGAVAAGIFLVINLPWIFLTPVSWLQSLVLPMTLPLFPTGGGLVGLGLGGATPLFPPIVYTILELSVYAGLLVGYWRWEKLAPYAGIFLPTLPLLLAWRSPSRYFILLPLLIVLAVALHLRHEHRLSAAAAPQ